MKKTLLLGLLLAACDVVRLGDFNGEGEHARELKYGLQNSTEEKQTQFSYGTTFVENQGQWDQEVAYKSDISHGSLWVTQSGRLVHSFLEPSANVRNGERKGWNIVEQFVNGKKPGSNGFDETATKYAYFTAKERVEAISNVRAYRAVNLGEIWNGIEVRLHSKDGDVEKYFHVHPFANPDLIKVKIEGGKRYHLDGSGQLVIATGLTGQTAGQITISKPIAYQPASDGSHKRVEVEYKLEGDVYSFSLGSHDRSKALIIDPILQFTTYTGQDHAIVQAVMSPEGDIFALVSATGFTTFPGVMGGAFETRQGGNDIVVSKITQDLGLVQSTILGTPFHDNARDLALLPNGEVVVVAETRSTTDAQIPPDRLAGANVFVAKLTNTLTSLLQSRVMGGTGNDDPRAVMVSLDGSRVTIVGKSDSIDFIGFSGTHVSYKEGFLSFLGSDLNAPITTEMFGTPSIDTIHTALALDDGRLIVGGSSNGGVRAFDPSGQFPTEFVPHQQAVLFAFNSAGQQLGAPLFWGSSQFDPTDAQNRIDRLRINHAGEILAMGYTNMGGPPNSSVGGGPPAWSNAVLMKVASDLSAVTSTIYIGGNSTDVANDFQVDSTDHVFVMGVTASTNFPAVTHGIQTIKANGNDGFLTKISPDLSQTVQSTYLGGNGSSDVLSRMVMGTNNEVIGFGSTNSTNFMGSLPINTNINRFIGFKISNNLTMCGDGVIQSNEQCDGENDNNQLCPNIIGAGAGGVLSCTSECRFDTSRCTFQLAVNKSPEQDCSITGSIEANDTLRYATADIINQTENIQLVAEAPPGFKLGPNHICGDNTECTSPSSCTFDLGTMDQPKTCTIDCRKSCGDDVLDPAEMCDGSSLGDETCISQGFAGGDLACTECAFNLSDCFHRLTVTKSGESASEQVITSVAGSHIECGAVCSQEFALAQGPNVVLDANVPLYHFVVWSGCSSVRNRLCVLDVGWTGDKIIGVTYSKPDTDNDGLFDLEECPSLNTNDGTRCPDPDGDGLQNIQDDDDDSDGIPTREEVMDARSQGRSDFDADDQLNWVDPDSDDDGVDDGIEGRVDQNNNGKLDYLDTSYPEKAVPKSKGCCVVVGHQNHSGSWAMLCMLGIFSLMSRKLLK